MSAGDRRWRRSKGSIKDNHSGRHNIVIALDIILPLVAFNLSVTALITIGTADWMAMCACT
jgi:hypothetical protein